MTTYLWIKLIHIVSATVLFGTGIGTAFFMLKAYRANSDEAMRVTSRNVVAADWLFTTPAVVVQFVTGLWLTRYLAIPWDSVWFVAVVGLYGLVGACWIPVVWIQIRIRELTRSGANRESYKSLMRLWVALGVPAFSAVLALFFLMVSRYGAYS